MEGRTLVQGLASEGGAAVVRIGILDAEGVFDYFIPDVSLPGTFAGGTDEFHDAIPDGQGGVLSVVQVRDVANGSALDLVAARFGPDGQPLWSPAERILTYAPSDQSEASVCPDAAGGAYVAWTDDRDAGK